MIATTTAGGATGVSYRYLPSGAVDKTIGTEADENASELGFIGGIKLSGGLVHLRARVYSPLARRFLQPDTLDVRRYTYSHGDPLNFYDPTGRGDEVVCTGGACTETIHVNGYPLSPGSGGGTADAQGGSAQSEFRSVTGSHVMQRVSLPGRTVSTNGSFIYETKWSVEVALDGQDDGPLATAGVGGASHSANTWFGRNGTMIVGIGLVGLSIVGGVYIGGATAVAVGGAGALGFVGGFSSALIQGQSIGAAAQLGVFGAGLGSAAVLAPAATMLSSMLVGGAIGFGADNASQLANGGPYNPYSALFNTSAGMLVGAAVGWVPASGPGPGLNQTLVQTLIGGPTATAVGVAGSLVPAP